MLRAAPWLAICALASGCTRNVHSDFPLSVGYEPLEACTAVAPDPVAETLGDPLSDGPGGGFCWAHQRGYLYHPIAEVWQVLLTCPCVSRIHTDRGFSVDPGPVEDFPLSFDIAVTDYSGLAVIGNVHWTHRYRGGPEPETGGPDPPVAYGVRFQKIDGISNIRVQSGSLQLSQVDATTTELAFVAWLNADQSGQTEARGAITDWYGELKNALESGCGTCPSF